MTRIGSLALLLLAWPAFAILSVQTSLEPPSAGVGDEVVLSVTVLSSDVVEASQPRPPDLSGFDLVDVWETSSSTSRMIQTNTGMDWEKQRRKVYNYKLKPKKAGRIAIGAFELTVNGKAYSTQPQTLEVLPKGKGPPKRVANDEEEEPTGIPGMPTMEEIDRADEDMFSRLLQRQRPGGGGPPRPEPQVRTMPANPNEAFFVQVEVDKATVYEGEQITASWYLYTRGQMETLDRVKFPDLRGFWKEPIEENPNIQFSEEIINGVVYRKALLASHALFPIKVGTATIDSYEIKSRVRLPVQGYGGFALGQPYEYTKSSPPVTITVKPLPTEGRPPSFSGAVGSFSVHATLENENAVMGQPFTYRIRLEGTGNAKGVELPAINWPPSIEMYNSKSDSHFYKDGHSDKEFDLLLIPRQEGEIELPAFDFTVFNPNTAKYETQIVPATKVHVAKGTGVKEAAASSANAPAAAALPPAVNAYDGERLPPPVLAYTAGTGMGIWFRSLYLWLVVFLIVIAVLVYKAYRELGSSQRRRNLEEIFLRRWKLFEKTKTGDDARRTGVEMLNMYYLVLGGIAGEKGSAEEVSKMLTRIPPSLRREFGQKISQQIELFQTLAFAPEEALGDLKSPARLQTEIAEARKVLTTLVRRLSEAKDE